MKIFFLGPMNLGIYLNDILDDHGIFYEHSGIPGHDIHKTVSTSNLRVF